MVTVQFAVHLIVRFLAFDRLFEDWWPKRSGGFRAERGTKNESPPEIVNDEGPHACSAESGGGGSGMKSCVHL